MDLSPLNKFIDRVYKMKAAIPRLSVELVLMIQKTLEHYIKETPGYENVSVSIISIDNNNERLTAIVDVNQPGLWFTEFGTGREGIGTAMWEYFPTVGLTFFSRGEMQHTKGWEYAYHPQTKKDFGWYYRGQFYTGEPARNGVTRAVLRIKYEGLSDMLAEWARMKL